jgi:carboxyl-terminal processing protease
MLAQRNVPNRPKQPLKFWALALALSVSACGGGGGGGGGDSAPVANTSGIAPSSDSAQRCSPVNPYASAPLRTGSLDIEKQWLRSYFDEAYLWYAEVPVVDPSLSTFSGTDLFNALDNYFAALKTPALTASGARKDRFGFIYPTAQWDALAQTGVAAGYGFEAVFGSYTASPSRNIRVAYIEPGTEALTRGLQRGDLLVSVDGVSADDNTPGGVDILNAALFPAVAGVAHQWNFSRAGVPLPTFTMTTASVTKKPVLTRTVVTAADGKKVGYLLFNDHLATAEAQLVEAVNFFNAQGIDDLVLDVRYNGGGYLYIASELAYMIAGPARTQNQVFEQLVYSDKRGADTAHASSRTPFYNTGTSNVAGVALPTLSLPRVYVLAQPGTCSASESIINGLRGVDVDVRLIGGTTCGKPYGFSAKDNCGISYFPVEFKGANAKSFGDYPDGFVPAGSTATGVPGCVVADDLGKPLGDAAESMLATALNYRLTGSCAVPVALQRPLSASRSGVGALPSLMLRGPARENRIVGPSR